MTLTPLEIVELALRRTADRLKPPAPVTAHTLAGIADEIAKVGALDPVVAQHELAERRAG